MSIAEKIWNAVVNEEERQAKIWTVWVGGVEVTDYLLNYEDAMELGQSYVDDGYDDVSVDCYEL